jgi:hypothetical protein
MKMIKVYLSGGYEKGWETNMRENALFCVKKRHLFPPLSEAGVNKKSYVNDCNCF